MTEKLGAAEWLRGIVDKYEAEGGVGCREIAELFGLCCDEIGTCKEYRAKEARAIADRIDAERALPEGVEWPRFEDGELVKIEDEVEFEGETMRVFSVAFTFNGWVLWCARESFDGRLCGSYGERVKRPTPKVLDADGVPIEVGDTVWCDGGDEPLRVTLIHTSGYRSVSLEGKGGEHYSLDPERLTHKRPDSWERLEEDAAKPACEYAGAQKSIVDADRYTCLNCPYDEPGPHTDAGCNERMRLDLVSRAKALAKKEEA